MIEEWFEGVGKGVAPVVSSIGKISYFFMISVKADGMIGNVLQLI